MRFFKFSILTACSFPKNAHITKSKGDCNAHQEVRTSIFWIFWTFSILFYLYFFQSFCWGERGVIIYICTYIYWKHFFQAVKKLFKDSLSINNCPFTSWIIQRVNQLNSSVDADVFASFIQDVDNPDDVVLFSYSSIFPLKFKNI